MIEEVIVTKFNLIFSILAFIFIFLYLVLGTNKISKIFYSYIDFQLFIFSILDKIIGRGRENRIKQTYTRKSFEKMY